MEIEKGKEGGAAGDVKKTKVVEVETNLVTPVKEKEVMAPLSPTASASAKPSTKSRIPPEGNMFSSPVCYRDL